MHQVLQSIVLILTWVIGFIVPCTQPQESGCNDTRLRSVWDFVTSKLLGDELIIGHVRVDRIDDPIAITPGKRLHFVSFVAVGFSKPRQIQPMSCPALTEMLRSQKLIHDFFVRVRRSILFESNDFFRSWW